MKWIKNYYKFYMLKELFNDCNFLSKCIVIDGNSYYSFDTLNNITFNSNSTPTIKMLDFYDMIDTFYCTEDEIQKQISDKYVELFL